MRDQAIYNTHPHIKSILEGNTAFDADGKQVVINEVLVKDEYKKLLREVLKIKAKKEAQRRIYDLAPQWQQSNLTARAVELIEKRLNLIVLTQAELDELAAGFAVQEKIRAIGLASNLIEADIDATTDPVSFDVEKSQKWPVLSKTQLRRTK